MTGPQPRADGGEGGGPRLRGAVRAHPRGRPARLGEAAHERRRLALASSRRGRACRGSPRSRRSRGTATTRARPPADRVACASPAISPRIAPRRSRRASAAALRGREARRRLARRPCAMPRADLPWVRDVRRCAARFPDALEVTFEAHEALARWDESRLVSARGEVFTADYEGGLPRFSGPEGTAAADGRRLDSRHPGGRRPARQPDRGAAPFAARRVAGEARLGALARARARRHRGAPRALRRRVAGLAAEACERHARGPALRRTASRCAACAGATAHEDRAEGPAPA